MQKHDSMAELAGMMTPAGLSTVPRNTGSSRLDRVLELVTEHEAHYREQVVSCQLYRHGQRMLTCRQLIAPQCRCGPAFCHPWNMACCYFQQCPLFGLVTINSSCSAHSLAWKSTVCCGDAPDMACVHVFCTCHPVSVLLGAFGCITAAS